jgi:hypothetical protein
LMGISRTARGRAHAVAAFGPRTELVDRSVGVQPRYELLRKKFTVSTVRSRGGPVR